MRFNTKNQIRPWTTQMEIKSSWIKRPCECTIAHDISLENVSRMHELSEAFRAISLRHTCLLSILEQFSKLSSRAGELNLQVEAERSYHQTVLATLEKLYDEVIHPFDAQADGELGLSVDDYVVVRQHGHIEETSSYFWTRGTS
ncbi:uncharacterized protein LOC117908766 isoform X3 [Vitis riparia]|uniref:uncharacterized protein LOC117908766 isoform X3 n=1 Tax=Vitis riparia TaxID=96939 RepID=UPI00155A9A2B|nr:uncharacterized protein LOC117908766 isoform X3 [Vitis riparia]